MKKYIFPLSFILSVIVIISCNSSKTQTRHSNYQKSLSQYDQHLIDSILQFGLDHEALYTLAGSLKPMSSLISIYSPIANTDSTRKTEANVLDVDANRKYLDKLSAVQRAMNKLEIPDLRFVTVPYQMAQKDKRIVQLSVVRISALDSLLKAKESFFGQFGLVPGTDPVVVLSMIENADIYERYRGYGYLFGYPDYAVDFFVKASLESKKTKKQLKRNFFQIPVYAGNDGYFVYAYPADHTPTMEQDSTKYYKALEILDNYKTIRPKYLKKDSTLSSYQLLQDIQYRSGK